jgi:hypothetical protein
MRFLVPKVAIIIRLTMIIILLALISNACTTITILHERINALNYTDSVIQPYFDSFIREAKHRNVPIKAHPITIIFGDTKMENVPNAIGVCVDFYGAPLIILNRFFWDASDVLEREELLFHELGHCVLMRDHCEVKDGNASITMMEPFMFSDNYYALHREALLDELFTPHAGCK